jgi:thiamine-phosphate pyrophosphorylase
MRATDIPPKREDIPTLLKANFKRIEEGLRVLEEYTGNSLYNRIRYEIYTLEKEIILTALKPILCSGVYLISDNELILEQGLTWKVSAIQLRDKINSKQIILKKALRIQKKAKQAGIPFIINDYLDVALLSDADGLHTGQDDLAIPLIRQLLGPHKLIGRSTQTLKEGIKAQEDGADYIGIGPILSTPSKPEQQAIGLNYLKLANKHITSPYVAIGGINLKTMAQIAPCKPPLVALIRAYKESLEIKKKYFSKQTATI